jgi:hypothetical protein
MLTVRFYLALRRLSWRALRRLGKNELAEEVDDRIAFRLFAYLHKLEKASGFYPVEVTRGPRPVMSTLPGLSINMITTGTSTGTTYTWTAPPPWIDTR